MTLTFRMDVTGNTRERLTTLAEQDERVWASIVAENAFPADDVASLIAYRHEAGQTGTYRIAW